MKFSKVLTFVLLNISLVIAAFIGGVYQLYFKHGGSNRATFAWQLYSKGHDAEVNMDASISSYSKQETLNRYKLSKLLKDNKNADKRPHK